MSLPKLLQKLFGNGGAGDKLKPEIIPIKVNGQSPDSTGEISVSATPPAISASAQSLPAGSTATVTKTGTDAAPVFTFGIPKGTKGDKGDAGKTLSVVVTAGAVGPTGNVTGKIGSFVPGVSSGHESGRSFVIPYFVINAYGQITGYTNRTITANCNCNCDCGCSDTDSDGD